MKLGPITRKLRFDRFTVLGLILILLAGFTLAEGWYFLHKQSDSIKCQTQYNKAFLSTLRARSDLSEKDRSNNEEFIASWGAPSNPEKAKAAAIKYLQTKAEIDAERNRFPFPNLPEGGRC